MELKNLDAKKILNFLEKEVSIELPEKGLLAGQSVSSAIMYLTGKTRNFFINDLDVFLSDKMLLDFKCDKNFHFKKNRSKRYFNNKENITSIDSGLILNVCYKELFTDMKDHSMLYSAVYENIKSQNNYRFSPSEKNPLNKLFSNKIKENSSMLNFKNIHRKAELINLSHSKKEFFILPLQQKPNRQLITSFRDGIFNYVIYEQKTSRTFYNLLESFDINCTKVGIDLEKKELIYTNSFDKFYNSKQVELDDIYIPYHSIIRYFKKNKEMDDFYFNNEMNSYFVNSFLKLKSNDFVNENWENDKKYLPKNLSENMLKRPDNLALKFSKLGEGYNEKYSKLNNIKNYYDISKSKTNEKLYDLEIKGGEDNVIKSLFNGEYKSYLEKKLDLKILNYPDFLSNNFNFHVRHSLNLEKKSKVNLFFNYQKNQLKKLTEDRKKTFDFNSKNNASRYNDYKIYNFLNSQKSCFFNIPLKNKDFNKMSNFLMMHCQFLEELKFKNIEELYKFTDILIRINKKGKGISHIGYIESNLFKELNLSFNSDYNLNQLLNLTYKLYRVSVRKIRNEEPLKEKFFYFETKNKFCCDEIVKTTELLIEGSVMKHCVGGYHEAIRRGDSVIIKVYSKVNTAHRATLELVKRGSKYYYSQFRTYQNEKPSEELYKALLNFSFYYLENVDLMSIKKACSNKINVKNEIEIFFENDNEKKDEILNYLYKLENA